MGSGSTRSYRQEFNESGNYSITTITIATAHGTCSISRDQNDVAEFEHGFGYFNGEEWKAFEIPFGTEDVIAMP